MRPEDGRAREDPVWVEAPARLHLGLFDLRGDLGRRYGGIGVAVRTPSLLVEASRADSLQAEGEQADRVHAYARRFLDHHGVRGGAALRVHRAIPAHIGLGSGTQLALATARALAALYGLSAAPQALARACGRARRSAIGTWAFGRGGFLVEGGRAPSSEGPAPLLLHCSMPETWRCVLAIPEVARGLSGSEEEAAFRRMARPSAERVGRIARLVLMLLLPSLVERDLRGFGRAVTEVQRLVGETFREVQGGAFAHPLVEQLIEELLAAGAAGAGQSSWGPTVYGFAEDDGAAAVLARRARETLEGRGLVLTTAFDNTGARCWSGAPPHP